MFMGATVWLIRCENANYPEFIPKDIKCINKKINKKLKAIDSFVSCVIVSVFSISVVLYRVKV